MRIISFPLLVGPLVATAVPAAACSVGAGYRVPTTLELAEKADLVVLARVDGGTSVAPGAQELPLALTPTLLLKGDRLPARIRMRGWLEARGAKATRSIPAELVEPNPDALSGGCNRYIFAKGMTLLLFLKRERGKLTVIDAPFARTLEDVPRKDARWVKAVREYIAIARLPVGQRKPAMKARIGMLRTGDADSRAIAVDMGRMLKGPNQPLREPLPPASSDPSQSS